MAISFKRLAIIGFGWLFLVLGVVGLVVPFLQGILFLLIGFSLLSVEYAWARRFLERLRDRFPGLSGRADDAYARFRTMFTGWFGGNR